MTDSDFRTRLIADTEQAKRHIEYFRKRSDWVRCQKKIESVKRFAELLVAFDTWKAPPKVKKVNDNGVSATNTLTVEASAKSAMARLPELRQASSDHN